ncbi:methyl-accepting chemotaxis protein [Massilia sp. DWR3-1-1]|uniref:methyl-accepting chemotaxis protein n=1 Tax=Massilia sp. DWR3-1-1 TaxID=2804559 RepID=UPI003CEA01DA
MAAQLSIDSVPVLAKPEAAARCASASTVADPPGVAGAGAELSSDVFGALINLSGRRRFTSQRVVLYAVLASLGHEGAEATARATLAQLREAHTTLMEGKGSLPGVFSGQLHDAYFGTLQGDRNIRAFISLAERTLDAIAGSGLGAPVLLDQLVHSATPLLSVLNGLTLVYEEQAKRHAQLRRRQLHEVTARLGIISHQARQLAFNAQVAAARAGEQGRDFGAVAASMTEVTAALAILVQEASGRSL